MGWKTGLVGRSRQTFLLCTKSVNTGIYITFEDGDEESSELRHLRLHMGYRWVRLDPRMTPGWTHLGKSGSGSGKSGKTGKMEKSMLYIILKLLTSWLGWQS